MTTTTDRTSSTTDTTEGARPYRGRRMTTVSPTSGRYRAALLGLRLAVVVAPDRPQVGDDIQLQVVTLAIRLHDLAQPWANCTPLRGWQIGIADHVPTVPYGADVAACFNNVMYKRGNVRLVHAERHTMQGGKIKEGAGGIHIPDQAGPRTGGEIDSYR